MNTVLCSVPVEAPGASERKQTEGPLPILPKSAITQLNDWATKNGLRTVSFLTSICFIRVMKKLKNFY